MREKIPETTEVYIRIDENGKTPLYATPGSAGCDLFAACELVLLPGQSRILPLNITIALEPGVEAQIRPRSGLSLRTSLRVPNSPGTIDSDYRDPVGVLLHNNFHQADLIDKLLADPDLAGELERKYRRTASPEYMSGLPLYLDANNNPYGTIYIKPGERIAQMVFSRHLRAIFTEHRRPEEIGASRGGGFGSTGGHADL